MLRLYIKHYFPRFRKFRYPKILRMKHFVGFFPMIPLITKAHKFYTLLIIFSMIPEMVSLKNLTNE